MIEQPEVLYLAVLAVFLVLLRSAWPWTRTGGLVLLTAATAAAWWLRPDLLDATLDPRRLPPSLLAVLTAVVGWWSLYKDHRPPETRSGSPGRRRASRLRFAGVALGLLATAALAVLIGAPPAGASESAGSGGTSWFLAGLLALAPMTGKTYACIIVPIVAVVGLVMAPELDAQDEHGGRRDELPFFLFAWLAVGIVPIVLAAWVPSFAEPHPVAVAGLAERFWLDWLGLPAPGAWPLRELPGMLLYGFVFAFLPWKLPAWKASKGVFGRHLRRLGPARYALVMGLAGALMLVPLKVALFVFLGVGPWIVVGNLAL